MSVFNENGALVYANNSNISVNSLDSIIAEAARMDDILENMVMEAIGQLNAANIVLETTGYVNESFKEVVKSGWAKAMNTVLKAIDYVVEAFHNLVPTKGIILANKNKIISKFDTVKNSDNESFKQCVKNYNAVSMLSSSELIEKIDEGIKLTKTPGWASSKYAEILGFDLKGDWRKDINASLNNPNASDDASKINISKAIDTALSFDKNIPVIKQKRREVENSLKNIEKIINSGSDEKTSDKGGLTMVSYYCVTAIKSLRLLATSSVKLCMAVLKYKEPKSKDSKASNSDNNNE